MSQQINLYLNEFHKKKDWLDLVNMLSVLGLLAIALLLVTGVEFWEVYGLELELEQKRQERTELAAETQQLINSFGAQSESEEMRLAVNGLEEEIQGKEILLSFLDGRNIGTTEGFSEYLADLARYHVAGLRLTSVRLSNGGNQINLDGEVLNAELVPLYLRNLRRGQSFTGKEFEMLRIKEAEDESDDKDSAYKIFNVATN